MVKVNGGKSEVDRITFYDSDIGVSAILLPNGEIKIEYEKKKISISVKKVGIFLIIFFLKLLFIMPYINKHTSMVYIYLIPALVYLLFVFAEIKKMRKKENRNQLKNHAAEHMVCGAYEKFKRMPTILEVKKTSRINSACGINNCSALITGQLIGFLVYRYIGYVIPEVFLIIIPVLMRSIFPFNVLGNLGQFLTTSKPEDANIILALTAMDALERNFTKKNHGLIN